MRWRASVWRGITLAVPIAIVGCAVGAAVLHVYSPLDFAANFTDPRVVLHSLQDASFAAGEIRGGAGLVYTSRTGPLEYTTLRSLRSPHSKPFALDGAVRESEPALASSQFGTLAAWIRFHGQTNSALVARIVGPKPKPVRTIVHADGVAEHPDVLSAGHGRFDVVYSASTSGTFDIYLAVVSARSGRLIASHRLVTSVGYGFYPHAAVGRNGVLNLAYMDFCCRQTDWVVLFRRFSASGSPLGRTTRLSYVPELASPSPSLPPEVPSQWGIDVEPDHSGGAWIAWQSNNSLHLVHLGPNGYRLSRTTIYSGLMDGELATVSLVPSSHGGAAIAETDSGSQTTLTFVRFDAKGKPTQTERTEYTLNATLEAPELLRMNSPVVLWGQTNGNGLYSSIMGSSYRKAVPPPITAQLGVNIGSAPIDILLMLAAAILGGAMIAVINAFFILPLILAWYPFQKVVRGRYRWLTYIALVAVALACAVAFQTPVSQVVLLIPIFRFPTGWIVVAGAAFCGYWLGKVTLDNEDDVFRAAAMVSGAIYFVAMMWILTVVQGLIEQA